MKRMEKENKKVTTKTPLRELKKLSVKELVALHANERTSEEDKKQIEKLIITPERADEVKYYVTIGTRIEERRIELDGIKFYLIGTLLELTLIKKSVLDKFCLSLANEARSGYLLMKDKLGDKMSKEEKGLIDAKIEESNYLLLELITSLKRNGEGEGAEGWVSGMNLTTAKEKIEEYNKAVENATKAFKLAKAKIEGLNRFIETYKEDAIILDTLTETVEKIKSIGKDYSNGSFINSVPKDRIKDIFSEELKEALILLEDESQIKRFPTYEELEVTELEVRANRIFL